MNPLYETVLANRAERDLSRRRAAAADPLSNRPNHQPRRRLRSQAPAGSPRHEAGPIPPRAGDVCMDSSKLIGALGYNPFDPWPLDEALMPTDRDWHYCRPADDLGSAEYLYRHFSRIRRGGVRGACCRVALASLRGRGAAGVGVMAVDGRGWPRMAAWATTNSYELFSRLRDVVF